MNKLPTETLCHVFLACLSDLSGARRAPELKETILIPLRISHVCQHWRRTSVSLKELWSYLSIFYVGEGIRSIQWWRSRTALLNIFGTWLQRTGDAPINFGFICSVKRAVEEDRHACEYIITTLLAQQRRWRDVCLIWGIFQPSPDLQAVDLTNMPLLTSLRLKPDRRLDQGINSTRIPVRIDISHSRRLRRLTIENVNSLEVGNETFDEMTGPVSIDSVKGSTSLADRIWALLQAAPNLRNFWFQSQSERDSVVLPNSMSMLILQNLRSLTYTCTTDSDVAPEERILENLVAPQLTSLTFSGSAHPRYADLFSDFIRRSMPPLVHLDVEGLWANECILVPVLRLLPGLEELRLSQASVSSQFFRALSVNSDADITNVHSGGTGESPICLALQRLRLDMLIYSEGVPNGDFEGDPGDDITGNAFLNMLTSRYKAFGTLSRIKFENSYEDGRFFMPLNHADSEELRSCIRGADITVDSGS